MGRQSKLRKARKDGGRKPAGKPPATPQAPHDHGDDVDGDAIRVYQAMMSLFGMDQTVPDPYPSDEAMQEDWGIGVKTVESFVDLDQIEEDWIAPRYVNRDWAVPVFRRDRDEDRVFLLPWTHAFREKLTAKYGSESAAEPYWRFTMGHFAEQGLDALTGVCPDCVDEELGADPRPQRV